MNSTDATPLRGFTTRGLAVQAWGDFRAAWRQSLAFHLLMQLLGLADLRADRELGRRPDRARGGRACDQQLRHRPLRPVAGRRAVRARGSRAHLGAGPGGARGAKLHCGTRDHAASRSVVSTVAFVLPRLPQLILLSARVFVRLVVLALPFLAAAALVWFTMLARAGHQLLPRRESCRVAAREADRRAAGGRLCAARCVAARALAFRGTDARARRAETGAGAQCERADDEGPRFADRDPLVLWWLLVTAAMVAMTWACRHLSDAGLAWAGIEVKRVLPLVALYVTVAIVGGFLYSAVHIGGHQFLTTRMYAAQHDPTAWKLPLRRARQMRSRRVAHPGVRASLCSLSAARRRLARCFAPGPDRRGSRTAHRGASMYAPENTMAAFRTAMDAGATYIELDVQRTRDGRIAVLHDGDLMRMGGDPRKLSELTLGTSPRSTSAASTTSSSQPNARRRSSR